MHTSRRGWSSRWRWLRRPHFGLRLLLLLVMVVAVAGAVQSYLRREALTRLVEKILSPDTPFEDVPDLAAVVDDYGGASLVAAHMVPLLADRDQAIRMRARLTVEAIGEAAIPPLVSALDDDSCGEAAAIELARQVPQATRHLQPLLAPQNSAEVRVRAARILMQAAAFGRHTAHETVQMVELLRDPQAEIRHMAADALGYVGPDAKPFAEPLAAAVDDANPQVSIAAVRALTRVDPHAFQLVQAYLEQLLRSDDPEVRHATVSAISFFGSSAQAMTPQIVALLTDDTPGVRRAAACALGSLEARNAVAIEALIVSLQDEDAQVSASAALSLGMLTPDSEVAAESLAQLAAHADAFVREEAALALRRIRRDARLSHPLAPVDDHNG